MKFINRVTASIFLISAINANAHAAGDVEQQVLSAPIINEKNIKAAIEKIPGSTDLTKTEKQNLINKAINVVKSNPKKYAAIAGGVAAGLIVTIATIILLTKKKQTTPVISEQEKQYEQKKADYDAELTRYESMTDKNSPEEVQELYNKLTHLRADVEIMRGKIWNVTPKLPPRTSASSGSKPSTSKPVPKKQPAPKPIQTMTPAEELAQRIKNPQLKKTPSAQPPPLPPRD